MDLNTVTFSGRLGGDPEMRYTQNERAVVNFRFALKIGKEKTLWFTVTAWGAMAENVNKYMSKGSRVAVTGRLDEDEWEGRDGVRRTTLKINATDIIFLDQKDGSSDSSQGGSSVDSMVDIGGSDEASFDDFPI